MKHRKRIKILPDRLFHKLWDESLKCNDSNSFIRLFSNPMSDKYISFKATYDIDIVTAIYLLNRIYEMSHMEFREVIESAGKGQADISHIFCIPKRTVQDWYSGKNRCPSYIMLMILRQFHLFTLSKYVKLQSEIEFYETRPSVYNKHKMVEDVTQIEGDAEQERVSAINWDITDITENSDNVSDGNFDDEDLWFLDRLNSIPDSTAEVDRLIKQEVENETVKDLLKRTAYLDRLVRD